MGFSYNGEAFMFSGCNICGTRFQACFLRSILDVPPRFPVARPLIANTDTTLLDSLRHMNLHAQAHDKCSLINRRWFYYQGRMCVTNLLITAFTLRRTSEIIGCSPRFILCILIFLTEIVVCPRIPDIPKRFHSSSAQGTPRRLPGHKRCKHNLNS